MSTPQYKTVVPLVALLILLSATPVSAQTPTSTPAALVTTMPTTTRKQFKEERRESLENLKKERQVYQEKVKNTRQEYKTKLEELKYQYQDKAKATAAQKKTERQGFLSQAKQTIVKRVYSAMEKRLTSRYQFLMSSKAKIQTRINEKSTAGLDVTAALAKLDTTKPHEDAYIKDLAALKSKLNETLTSDNPVQGVNELSKLARVVTRDLNSLKQVEVAAMKLVIQSGKLPKTTRPVTSAVTAAPTTAIAQ